jgi:hypothetical protein
LGRLLCGILQIQQRLGHVRELCSYTQHVLNLNAKIVVL